MSSVLGSPKVRNALKVVGRVLACVLGAFGVVKIFLAFHVPLLPDGWPGIVILLMAGAILWLALEVIRLHGEPTDDEAENLSPERAAAKAIVKSMGRLVGDKKYEAVLHFREHFSRFMFVAGCLHERLELGRIAEKAASLGRNPRAKAHALIDDIGWTLVALGRYEDAVRSLEHGLKEAESVGDFYLQAKGIRHLAGIKTQKRAFPDAARKLRKAREVAEKIPREKTRLEMMAGIDYGLATAEYLRGRYPEAKRLLSSSRDLRERVGDRSRIVKVYALQAKILEAEEKLHEARDLYREGLREAEAIDRVDEMVRNLRGLSRVAGQLGDPNEALACKERADRLEAATPVPYEIAHNMPQEPSKA